MAWNPFLKVEGPIGQILSTPNDRLTFQIEFVHDHNIFSLYVKK